MEYRLQRKRALGAAAARLAAAPPEPDIIKGSRRVRLPAGSPLAGKGLSLRAAAARRRR